MLCVLTPRHSHPRTTDPTTDPTTGPPRAAQRAGPRCTVARSADRTFHRTGRLQPSGARHRGLASRTLPGPAGCDSWSGCKTTRTVSTVRVFELIVRAPGSVSRVADVPAKARGAWSAASDRYLRRLPQALRGRARRPGRHGAGFGVAHGVDAVLRILFRRGLDEPLEQGDRAGHVPLVEPDTRRGVQRLSPLERVRRPIGDPQIRGLGLGRVPAGLVGRCEQERRGGTERTRRIARQLLDRGYR